MDLMHGGIPRVSRRVRRLRRGDRVGGPAGSGPPWRWQAALGIAVLALAVSVVGGFAWSRRGGVEGGIDRAVPLDLRFQTLQGQATRLSDWRGRNGLVVIFLGTQCPVGNQYVPRLVELHRRFGPRGVGFLGVNANASETVEQVAAHAKEFGLTFPVVKDPENQAADRLRVGRTCEALLIDGEGVLRYRGAIDDEFRQGAQKGHDIHPYLAQAIETILSGKRPAVATSAVVGCPIERVEPSRARNTTPRVRAAHPSIVAAREAAGRPAEVGPVTYAKDVAPILQAKCQECHRPRQVAPFSLLTYKDARRWATGIAEVVEDYRMPPWHADPRYGRFENDRSLTGQERAVLLAWVRQGAPAGNLDEAPPARKFVEGWTIGAPDLVFEMLEPFVVPADGDVDIQRFRVPTRLARDTWVQAAEMQPGDRAVVHHMFIYVEPHKDDLSNTHRTGPVLVAYAPGDAPAVYPPGIAKRIPAGADLLFEVHYTPIGRERIDRSSVGLILARAPVRHEAIFKGVSDKTLVIPPHEPHYRSVAAHTFVRPVHLLNLFPHMHLRGKDFLFTAVYPDGRRERLLSVPAYDFAWQSIYRLAEPLSLPAGTRLVCEAHFDNSAGNPVNPDPSQTVRWGDLTTDEMMIGFIEYYEDDPSGETPSRHRKRRHAGVK